MHGCADVRRFRPTSGGGALGVGGGWADWPAAACQFQAALKTRLSRSCVSFRVPLQVVLCDAAVPHSPPAGSARVQSSCVRFTHYTCTRASVEDVGSSAATCCAPQARTLGGTCARASRLSACMHAGTRSCQSMSMNFAGGASRCGRTSPQQPR